MSRKSQIVIIHSYSATLQRCYVIRKRFRFNYKASTGTTKEWIIPKPFRTVNYFVTNYSLYRYNYYNYTDYTISNNYNNNGLCKIYKICNKISCDQFYTIIIAFNCSIIIIVKCNIFNIYNAQIINLCQLYK